MTWLLRAGLAISFAGLIWMLWPSQEADPDFRPRASSPAFRDRWPVAMVDAGHYNAHTAADRYRPLAQLLARDGFRVLSSDGRITRETLRRADVFITANPLGVAGLLQHAANLAGLSRVVTLKVDAFAQDEIDTLAAWVGDGGAALIVADHAPAGNAARRLAAAFGVEMRAWWVEDPEHHDPVTQNPGALVFSRMNGLLAEHPITNGRGALDRVDVVITFTGQALSTPPQAEVLLRLSTSAREYPYRVSREREGRSAAGLAQAVAVRHGRGRVVVMGEAGALSAQLLEAPGVPPTKIGMNRSGIDNDRFVLNAMRWLMGLLE